MSSMHGKRVLITGAAGFIGTHLIKHLENAGAIIGTLDLQTMPDGYRFQHWVADLQNAADIQRCLDDFQPTHIFHLAAFKERSVEVDAFIKGLSVNVLGSLNLFSAACHCKKIEGIVVLGSAEEYGRIIAPYHEKAREHPISAYSFSKLCLTNLSLVLCDLFSLPVVVIRPSVAYGPGQGLEMFLPALIRTLLAGKPFPMTPGQQTRDFIYVSDLVSALILAAQQPKAIGKIINCGSGNSVTIASLALKVEKLLGKSGLVQIGALPYRAGEIMDYRISLSRISTVLGWSPVTTLESGLAATISDFEHCIS